jgi:hypothetical protein
MTGQVKEDVLARFGELGVFVEKGHLVFYPCLLQTNEFLSEAQTFNYINVNGEAKQLTINANSLAFTYCQVPVIYTIATENSISVTRANGDVVALDLAVSSEIFGRTGAVAKIHVNVAKENLK